MRRSIAAATILLVAGTSLAQSSGRQGYVVVKRDGRKIEGKITVKDGRVTIDLGSHSSTDFAVDEVTITYTEPAGGGSENASKKRWVEIEKKDGGIVRGEVTDEKADSITIRPKGQSPLTFKLSEVKVTPIDDAGPAETELGDRYVDYEGRFQIERPSPDWKIKKSTSPETRALMMLTGKDAFVSVSVRPLPSVNPIYLDPGKDTAKKLQQDVDTELKASDLEKYGGLQLDASELFGVNVVEARYEGNYPGEATVYQFIEQRFVREGHLYTIRAAAEKKTTFKEVEAKLREAFTCFSFIAPQGGDETTYNDLIKGFGIERPSQKWTVEARPFDEKEPVVIRNEDGRAELRVFVGETGARDAAQYVDEYLKQSDKKAEFTVVDKKAGHRAGVDTTSYHCSYFEGRSTRKCDEQGLVAVVDGRFVQAIGIAPFVDADAKDLQKEVAKALEGLQIFDPRRKRLGDGAKAAEGYSRALEAVKKKQWADALQLLNEAIRIYPDYARAYFVRAACNIEQKAWKDYRDDLAHALDLDPRPETAARAATLYLAEAAARTKEKQWPEACKAWKEAVRADSKNEKLRKDFLRFYQDWWAALKSANPGAKMKDGLDDIEEHRWSDKEFEPIIATMCCEAGQAILQADRKQWQKARSLAAKALNYDRDCKAAKELIKACDDAKKQLESSQPKHGK